MKKALWLSRHELNSDQLTDIEKKMGDKVEVVMENITWQATDDDAADYAANVATWRRLVEEFAPDAVLGVFPPVALESVPYGMELFSPISRQNATMRADGTKQIVFEHVRWSRNLNRWR
jgi:hypothetical protein